MMKILLDFIIYECYNSNLGGIMIETDGCNNFIIKKRFFYDSKFLIKKIYILKNKNKIKFA